MHRATLHDTKFNMFPVPEYEDLVEQQALVSVAMRALYTCLPIV